MRKYRQACFCSCAQPAPESSIRKGTAGNRESRNNTCSEGINIEGLIFWNKLRSSGQYFINSLPAISPSNAATRLKTYKVRNKYNKKKAKRWKYLRARMILIIFKQTLLKNSFFSHQWLFDNVTWSFVFVESISPYYIARGLQKCRGKRCYRWILCVFLS